MRELFKSAKEVMLEACEENGNTPTQELIGCISMAALIPTLWLALYINRTTPLHGVHRGAREGGREWH